MKYLIDFSFWYDGQLVKVWDYSPRNDLYTLISTEDGNNEKFQLTEQDIDSQIEDTSKHWAKQIVKNIINAKSEVERWSASYGNQRDLGLSIVNAYKRGLLTSPDFYSYLLNEVRRVEESQKQQIT
jgi:hypothetical protein